MYLNFNAIIILLTPHYDEGHALVKFKKKNTLFTFI